MSYNTIPNTAKRFYYLKDHLGSIQVVVDTVGEIVSYDAGVYPALSGKPWGIILNGRSTNSAYINAKYKFTSKERDVETGYDYFACLPKSERRRQGARYYDSRIGRWLQVDPLFEKHPDFSPYNYVLNNPLKLIDPDGKQSTDWWKVLFRAFVRVITKPIKNEAIDEILKKNDSKDMLGERPLGSKGEDIDNDGIDDSRDGIDNRDYFKEMVKFKKMEDKINESFRKSVEEGIKKEKQNLFQKPFQQSEENKTTETSNYELDYLEPNEPLSPIELREDKTENIRR